MVCNSKRSYEGTLVAVLLENAREDKRRCNRRGPKLVFSANWCRTAGCEPYRFEEDVHGSRAVVDEGDDGDGKKERSDRKATRNCRKGDRRRQGSSVDAERGGRGGKRVSWPVGTSANIEKMTKKCSGGRAEEGQATASHGIVQVARGWRARACGPQRPSKESAEMKTSHTLGRCREPAPGPFRKNLLARSALFSSRISHHTVIDAG